MEAPQIVLTFIVSILFVGTILYAGNSFIDSSYSNNYAGDVPRAILWLVVGIAATIIGSFVSSYAKGIGYGFMWGGVVVIAAGVEILISSSVIGSLLGSFNVDKTFKAAILLSSLIAAIIFGYVFIEKRIKPKSTKT